MKGSRNNREWHSVKHKETGLKLHIAASANSAYGPFILQYAVARGSASDLTISRQSLEPLLLPNEIVLADRLYDTDRYLTATRYRGVHPDNVPQSHRAVDKELNSHQAPIERVNGWIKKWKVFKGFRSRDRTEGTPREALLFDIVAVVVTMVNRNVLDRHGETASMFQPCRACSGVNAGPLGGIA